MLAPAHSARILVALVALPLWMASACAADPGDPAKPEQPPSGGDTDAGVDANPTQDSSGSSGGSSSGVGSNSSSSSGGSSSSGSGNSSGGFSSGGSGGGSSSGALPEGGPPPVDAGGCTMNCPLAAEYMTSLTGSNVSDITADFEIVNLSALGQDLTKVTLRYWFLANGAPMLQFSCDYALIDCKNVTATFVTMAKPTTKADTYLQLSFSSTVGMLASGENTGTIQTRFHNSDYQVMFTPSGDYSFNAKDTMFTQTTTVTLYSAGQLVWGVEPQ
jgi:hypothetical protein